MKKINYVKFAIDVIMAVAFVLLFNKRVFGGMTFHEVAGTAIGVAFLTHLALNWKWIKNVTRKLFDKKLPGKTRFSFGLNLLLLICMATIMASGIFVSRVLFPNVNIGNEGSFKMLHISLSFLTLIMVGIHVGMHWKWVINVWNKMLSIKEPRSWMNWAAKGVMAVVLVFGLFQIYETGFMARAASPFGLVGGNTFAAGKGMDRDGEGGKPFTRPVQNDQNNGTSEKSEGQGPPEQGSFQHERPAFGGEGQRGGEGFGEPGHEFGGNVSPLSVIATYTGIMAVFVIAAYYFTQWMSRRKRKTE
ncbi:protein of unknown function [Fictibacillus solisalsi]|uniref:Flavinylation-associated cytochrome domain-containing protein n=1 Tax=Fictibacillus solisalsi TaxID=459525 RepID=A0A1G9YSV6_9BACL|nr:DUF4405 domain-containing protein [Fictibacillus solisalsi]SDN11715.1 protein of unknown function [Fictibacillus solisalsi]